MQKHSEILAIISSIESTSFSDVQSIDVLLDFGFKLTSWLAFTGEAMSEAKKKLHDARRASYLKVEASLNAQQKKWSPMLAKDYVNDCCSNENAYYELCERCNRACTHTLDLVRTAISALKTELQLSNFQNNS